MLGFGAKFFRLYGFFLGFNFFWGFFLVFLSCFFFNFSVLFLGFKSFRVVRQWWQRPLILVLGRQRQLGASLVYRVSPRTVWNIHRVSPRTVRDIHRESQ